MQSAISITLVFFLRFRPVKIVLQVPNQQHARRQASNTLQPVSTGHVGTSVALSADGFARLTAHSSFFFISQSVIVMITHLANVHDGFASPWAAELQGDKQIFFTTHLTTHVDRNMKNDANFFSS
jgi:hypothetical protein